MKRALDLVGATAILVLASPVMAVAALVIRLESRGHPIYRQRRVGKDGHPFEIYKFRTMVDGAEHIGAGMAVNEGDPRITRFGHVLRRWSLDELPNLVNVVRGEMSLVGPRPTIQVQVDQYTPHQRRRLEVKPGITGWAQVNGYRGETSSIDKMLKRVDHDLYYIDHWSLMFDIRILLMTLLSPRSYRNAY